MGETIDDESYIININVITMWRRWIPRW